jgi:hypothetical protein
VSTDTLEQLRQAHRTMADMLEQLAAVQTPVLARTTLTLAAAAIELNPGERYAGLVLDDAGQPSHHLILLPGQAEDVNWTAAMEWARKAGGELPRCCEQALLYANAKSEFEAAWYWSGEEHTNGSSAWFQDFNYGYQLSSDKSYEARARAVRRFVA